MAEISMLVTSIDPLAAYKVSDDLILELMSVTASVEDDSEGASVGTWWVQIVEPNKMVKHQPHGGYMLENRQVQITCAKSAAISLGDRIKFQDRSITGMDSVSEAGENVAPMSGGTSITRLAASVHCHFSKIWTCSGVCAESVVSSI